MKWQELPLLLMTPGADELVGPWRSEHDWAARFGVTAHVTVRMPFLEPDDWGNPPAELGDLLPVEMTLARLENRPGALVVIAEPDRELRALTDAVGRMWPSLPPHKSGYEHPAYHVTVVRTADPDVRRRATAAIAPCLPMRVSGIALWAACGSPDNGLVHGVVATVASGPQT